MQPLDLVKTRLQLQKNTGPSTQLYNGVFDCLKKMYASEGFLSFYKGIIPPIMAETPKRAVKVKFAFIFNTVNSSWMIDGERRLRGVDRAVGNKFNAYNE